MRLIAAIFMPRLLNDDQKRKPKFKVFLIGILMLRIYKIDI